MARSDTVCTPVPKLDELVLLAEGYKLEPLVDRWHAWTHTLAPAQQAMNLEYRYLPALRSFVMSPQVHVAASQDPDLFGGPFVDLPVEAVQQVQAYIEETSRKRADALKFAKAFRQFDQQLLTSANGFSLDQMKRDAPNELKGRIELVYDLNKHPKINLLEEMFAIDDMGAGDAQSVLVHTARNTERPFFLSAPRILETDNLHIEARFDSEAVKVLAESRSTPVRFGDIVERLGRPADELAKYFVPASEGRFGSKYEADGIRIRYFGHASLLIETRQACILIDPTFAPEREESAPEHLRFEDLPEHIDLIAISHGHQDHMCAEDLMLLRHRTDRIIVPRGNSGDLADPSLKLALQQLGFASIIQSDPMEKFEISDLMLTTLPFSGEHCDLDVHAKQCFMVEGHGQKIGLFVDSDAIDIDVYGRMVDMLRGMNVVFVGMECNGAPLSWLYGPLTSSAITKKEDNSRRLSGANCDQASALVELVQPEQAFVYAMGQEAWMKHLMGLNYKEDSIQLTESADFVERCRARGIESERLFGVKDLLIY